MYPIIRYLGLGIWAIVIIVQVWVSIGKLGTWTLSVSFGGILFMVFFSGSHATRLVTQLWGPQIQHIRIGIQEA